MTGKVVALLALALLAACSGGLQQSELYGTYLATYENGTETLTLDKGGTFVQEIRVTGIDAAVVNSGTWKYGDGRVDLQNCLSVGDTFGRRIRSDFAAIRGVCSPSIGRRFLVVGEVRLGGDEDPTPLWKVR